MKLRFVAAGDACLPERHADGSHFHVPMGQHRRYVGRDPVPAYSGVPKALEKPVECDSDAARASYLAKACKAGDLLAFDAETAAFCGVEFASLDFVGGAWARKPKATKSEGKV